MNKKQIKNEIAIAYMQYKLDETLDKLYYAGIIQGIAIIGSRMLKYPEYFDLFDYAEKIIKKIMQ
jgi:hypothetical protein